MSVERRHRIDAGALVEVDVQVVELVAGALAAVEPVAAALAAVEPLLLELLELPQPASSATAMAAGALSRYGALTCG